MRIQTSWTGFFNSNGFMISVTPMVSALASFSEFISIPIILEAPLERAPSTAASPTAPRPNTATVDPACTLAVFHAAPRPVVTPQLSKVMVLRGAFGSILTTQAESTTVYSLKVEVLRKW